jgi:hypothetical protein
MLGYGFLSLPGSDPLVVIITQNTSFFLRI